MSVGDEIASLARSKVGAPYQYNASGPDSFDQAGFSHWAYEVADIPIPRSPKDQYNGGKPVTTPAPGDLVFFGLATGFPRVGVVVSDTEYAHLPNSKAVEIGNLTELTASEQVVYKRYW
jgi:cell wall-associated NlpC family hydrolase